MRSFKVGVTAPQPAVDDNSTQLTSSSWYVGQKATAAPLKDGTAAAGTSARWAPIDHVHPADIVDVWPANPNWARMQDANAVVAAAAFIPYFYPVVPVPQNSFVLSAAAVWIGTLLAASTVGVAIYSVSVTGSRTFTATRQSMLNADISGAAVAYVVGDMTTGAFGSGAATYTMDFTVNRYWVGVMTSATATLALHGGTAQPGQGSGVWKWTSAARATAHDWPATFANTDVGTGATIKNWAVDLFTATGKQWF